MDQPPPIPTPPPVAASLPHMSLPARLLNVFAIPGEVFQDVKAAPRSLANWIVPILLSALVGAATVLSLVQPALVADFRDSQLKKCAEQVAAGRISKTDADRAIATLEWISQPVVLKTAGTLFYAGTSVVRVFWWALAIWLFGRVFLKARFRFLKALEIAGLATMISVLENVVALVLTAGFDSHNAAQTWAQLATMSQTPLRMIMGNLFNIWLVALLATGLARLAGVPFARTFMIVLGAWIALQLFLALVGIALLALAG